MYIANSAQAHTTVIALGLSYHQINGYVMTVRALNKNMSPNTYINLQHMTHLKITLTGTLSGLMEAAT